MTNPMPRRIEAGLLNPPLAMIGSYLTQAPGRVPFPGLTQNREGAVLRKFFLTDLIGALVLLTGCMIAGLAVNELRATPLPLVYVPPEARLHRTGEDAKPPAADGDVDTDEMRKISLNHGALILDARPASIYRAGHIPTALNLPRDDFDRQYQALRSTLQARRDQLIIVYCSMLRCSESQVVAEALKKLGYPHVRLYRLGWFDWQNARLPEEKE